ncbi:hypothetical protein [Nafulsella turpanensis]|uniref:hypothetical protein n=1 Tax=Nafulsella turpanensis TaxID=1265690 RepID=UPI000347987A|nr:hypothetical protein [Nafulsella turpanensis]
MDSKQIEVYTGLGIQTVTLLLQSYSSFKRNNVDEFFKMLLEEQKDLSQIGRNKGLEKQFYWIIEQVASESHSEKIVRWKNLLVKLATNFTYQDYMENYLKILEGLTAFDLTVFTHIYGNKKSNATSIHEVCSFFEEREVPKEVVKLSVKKLASNNLLNEMASGRSDAMRGIGNLPMPFFYSKNELGEQFLDIISKS